LKVRLCVGKFLRVFMLRRPIHDTPAPLPRNQHLPPGRL